MAFVRLCASSNLRTMTSHFVDLQMCFEFALTASEKSVRPAARSTASTVEDVSSTTESECAMQCHTGHDEVLQLSFVGNDRVGEDEGPGGDLQHVRRRRRRWLRREDDLREMGRHSNVGRRTDDFVRLCNVCGQMVDAIPSSNIAAYHTPFAVRIELRQVQRDGEDVDVRERRCQTPTPIFHICPIYETSGLVRLSRIAAKGTYSGG